MRSYRFTRTLDDGSSATEVIRADNFREAMRLYRRFLATLES